MIHSLRIPFKGIILPPTDIRQSWAVALYGLRLDGLQGDTSKEYTFSFDRPGALMLLDIDLDGGTDGGPAVWIHGTAFGGEDLGGTYSATNSGLWDIDFMYSVNGASSPSGQSAPNIDVDPGSIANLGSLTITSGSWTDGGINTTYQLTDYPNNNDSFYFEFGTHRVSPAQWVGWGWLNHDGYDGNDFPTNDHVYSSDWLFTATPAPVPQTAPVPEPASFLVWSLLAFMGGAVTVRRRRDDN